MTYYSPVGVCGCHDCACEGCTEIERQPAVAPEPLLPLSTWEDLLAERSGGAA